MSSSFINRKYDNKQNNSQKTLNNFSEQKSKNNNKSPIKESNTSTINNTYNHSNHNYSKNITMNIDNPFQVMLNHYKGMCNFIIFAIESSPYIIKKNNDEISLMSLENFFKAFEHLSAYGNDIYFLNEYNEVITVNYSPTLSSMLLVVKDNKIIQALITNLTAYQTQLQEQTVYCFNDNLQVTIKNNEAYIEYYETKPFHKRKIFSEQINDILKAIDISITLSQIDLCSWFCIAWTPLKASKQQMTSTSFLVYYQFSYTKRSNSNDETNEYYKDYNEIPLIGILPIRFNEEIWLKRIKMLSSLYPVFNRLEMNDFQMALNDSIANVHEFIFNKTKRTSYDYDFYLKTINNHT